MQYPLLLPIMIFLHIIDDFCLQGILAKMKQKSWWDEQNKPWTEKYWLKHRYDWLPPLICHAFEWSFMILLPILVYSWDMMTPKSISIFMTLLVQNTIVHAYIDHSKCNLMVINLVTDQSIHITQIVVTWVIWLLWIISGGV